MDIPTLHGNWVDLIIILVIVYYVWGNYTRGLIIESLELLGLVFSFLLSLKYYPSFGKILIDNFSLPLGISNAIGFLLSGVIFEAIISSVIGLLYGKVYKKLPKIDQRLGFIPKIGEAVIFISFFLTLFIALPVQGWIKKDISDSKIGSYLVLKTQKVEKQINSIFTPAISETLNFFTVEPKSAESVNLHFTTTDVKVDNQAENTMYNLVNQARAASGQKKLSLNQKLTDLARAYGKEMFKNGYFSHFNPQGQSPFDRMTGAGINFSAAGENLALAPNVSFAMTGLLNSPGHRANILSPDFNRIGIGVIDGGIYGEIFVQEFTD